MTQRSRARLVVATLALGVIVVSCNGTTGDELITFSAYAAGKPASTSPMVSKPGTVRTVRQIQTLAPRTKTGTLAPRTATALADLFAISLTGTAPCSFASPTRTIQPTPRFQQRKTSSSRYRGVAQRRTGFRTHYRVWFHSGRECKPSTSDTASSNFGSFTPAESIRED
jgi:hypothetical protein